MGMNSSPNSHQPSNPPKDPKPEEMVMPPLPRPLLSRTSKRPLPPESLRDSMMDNHSSKLPERCRPSRECSHKSMIWREDSVSCNPSSQSSRTPSRPSKRSLMSEEWERNERTHDSHQSFLNILTIWLNDKPTEVRQVNIYPSSPRKALNLITNDLQICI